jgi:peptidoglycan DL-endopeptidase CwlO
VSLQVALDRIGQIESTIGRLAGRPEVASTLGTMAPAVTGTALTDLTARGAMPLGASASTGPGGTEALFAQALSAVRPPVSAGASAATPAPLVDDGRTTGADVVASARKYLGVPYVWGGESLAEGGLDCSGLVQLVFSDLGVGLPRVAREQMRAGQEVPSLAQARPGDLIVTRGGAHIGIYVGDNKMLHAPRPGSDVEIRELFETDADITTIRRIVPTDAGATGTDILAAAQAAAATGGAR